jgi:hypothetical protein
MTVASATVTTAAQLAVVSAPSHDRDWCTEVAARTDTDWPDIIDGCRDLLAIAIGENTGTEDTFEPACPESDRKAASRRADVGTLRAHRLLADDGISYERAYWEIMRGRPAPETMVEALMYSLRRGVNELTKPDTLRRLSMFDEGQLRRVCRRVQNFNAEIATPWPSEEVAALIARWRELHG